MNSQEVPLSRIDILLEGSGSFLSGTKQRISLDPAQWTYKRCSRSATSPVKALSSSVVPLSSSRRSVVGSRSSSRASSPGESLAAPTATRDLSHLLVLAALQDMVAGLRCPKNHEEPTLLLNESGAACRRCRGVLKSADSAANTTKKKKDENKKRSSTPQQLLAAALSPFLVAEGVLMELVPSIYVETSVKAGSALHHGATLPGRYQPLKSIAQIKHKSRIRLELHRPTVGVILPEPDDVVAHHAESTLVFPAASSGRSAFLVRAATDNTAAPTDSLTRSSFSSATTTRSLTDTSLSTFGGPNTISETIPFPQAKAPGRRGVEEGQTVRRTSASMLRYQRRVSKKNQDLLSDFSGSESSGDGSSNCERSPHKKNTSVKNSLPTRGGREEPESSLAKYRRRMSKTAADLVSDFSMDGDTSMGGFPVVVGTKLTPDADLSSLGGGESDVGSERMEVEVARHEPSPPPQRSAHQQQSEEEDDEVTFFCALEDFEIYSRDGSSSIAVGDEDTASSIPDDAGQSISTPPSFTVREDVEVEEHDIRVPAAGDEGKTEGEVQAKEEAAPELTTTVPTAVFSSESSSFMANPHRPTRYVRNQNTRWLTIKSDGSRGRQRSSSQLPLSLDAPPSAPAPTSLTVLSQPPVHASEKVGDPMAPAILKPMGEKKLLDEDQDARTPSPATSSIQSFCISNDDPLSRNHSLRTFVLSDQEGGDEEDNSSFAAVTTATTIDWDRLTEISHHSSTSGVESFWIEDDVGLLQPDRSSSRAQAASMSQSQSTSQHTVHGSQLKATTRSKRRSIGSSRSSVNTVDSPVAVPTLNLRREMFPTPAGLDEDFQHHSSRSSRLDETISTRVAAPRVGGSSPGSVTPRPPRTARMMLTSPAQPGTGAKAPTNATQIAALSAAAARNTENYATVGITLRTVKAVAGILAVACHVFGPVESVTSRLKYSTM